MTRNLIQIWLLFAALLFTTAVPQYAVAQKGKEKPYTVVIDPGHGGVDPGALGRRAKEKVVNLKSL